MQSAFEQVRRETLEEEVTYATNEASMVTRRHTTLILVVGHRLQRILGPVGRDRASGVASAAGSVPRDKSAMPVGQRVGELSVGNPTPAFRKLCPLCNS
jgi:hypothetical protein